MSQEDLTDFVEQVTGESHLRVEDDLGDGFVRLRLDEAERRQAKHDIRSSEDNIIEMLRNARDAHAHSIFVATQKEGAIRRIVMIDDGDGVPIHMLERIFEPRVTSKLDTMHIDTWGVHGRGMALYSIKVNADQSFVVDSQVGGGSAFCILSDTTKLPEKTDQSTKPTFTKNDKGTIVVRGPRNIIRTVTEFAYVDRQECSVYCGSIADIAATLYAFGMQGTTAKQRAFGDVMDAPICRRLSMASDPSDFVVLAGSLGLDISERTARRIIDGQITPLNSVAENVSLKANIGSKKKGKAGKAKAQKRGDTTASVRIQPADLEGLAQDIQQSFKELAQAYYLDESVEPQLTVHDGSIRVNIPLHRQID